MPDIDINTIIKLIYRKKFFSRRIDVTPELLGLIEKTIMRGEPLKLFYLWGVYKKENTNKYDEVAISFLSMFINHIKKILSCHVDFTIVISDVHSEINQIPHKLSVAYIEDITCRALREGWKIRRLSDIWDNYGLTQKKVFERAEETPDEFIDDLLMNFASKYFAGEDKKIGAKRYYVARQMEKDLIQREFRDYIHITATDTRLLYLQPQMPHFQVWTLKKGRSIKPWFLTGD